MRQQDESPEKAATGAGSGRWLLRWLPTGLWMVAIFVVSTSPSIGRTPGQGGVDKIKHFLAYALLAALVYRSLNGSAHGYRLGRYVWGIATGAAVYGLLLEFYQISVPGRDFEWMDVVANCLGIVIALTILLYWYNNSASINEAQSVEQNRQEEEQVSHAIEITADSFESEALEADVPVMVDFWAPWCGPCHMISPVLENLAEKYAGKIKLGKVNLDEYPQLAVRYGIRAIPAVFIFKDGQVAERVIGVQSESHFTSLVDQLLGE